MAAADHISGPASRLAARATVPQTVVHRSFVHETVVLNLDTGRYHGLNPTGGRMLAVVAASDSIGVAATALAAEFELPIEEIQGDLIAFCEDLAERGLLVIEPS